MPEPMHVEELLAYLQACPPEAVVTVQIEDDEVDITGVVYELGSVRLETDRA